MFQRRVYVHNRPHHRNSAIIVVVTISTPAMQQLSIQLPYYDKLVVPGLIALKKQLANCGIAAMHNSNTLLLFDTSFSQTLHSITFEDSSVRARVLNDIHHESISSHICGYAVPRLNDDYWFIMNKTVIKCIITC